MVGREHPWRELTLGEIARRQALRQPNAVALETVGKQVRYGELHRRATAVASALDTLGVRPLDRVAIRLHNCPEMVESIFACHLLGAVAVPINVRLSGAEAEYIVEDADTAIVIADEEGEALGASWPRTRWLVIGPGGSYENALAAAAPLPDRLVRDNSAAFLIYTSGTTGRPKGALLTHRNFVVNAFSFVIEVGVLASDTFATPFPLFHVGGLVGLYPMLLAGGRLHLLPSTRFDPAATLQALRSASMCGMVPLQWDQVLAQESAEESLTGIRRAIWGAAPAPRPLLQRMNEALPSGSVVCTFGQTEVTANATFLKPDDSIRKIGSVGRPALTVEHRVVDEFGKDVSTGAVGEIIYRGPTVMREYWNNPGATAEAFAEGWFHSGDLVYEDDEGFIYAVDRKKDLIISGGENVYPAEVERVLIEHPAIADVAVVAIEHERWGERPVAYVVKRGELTASDVVASCEGRLARYKIPSAVVFVEALPRNAGGKVLKRELRQRVRADVPLRLGN